MVLSNKCIAALSKIITGDGGTSINTPYRRMRDLVDFFNEVGDWDDDYNQNTYSRASYTEKKLRDLNNSSKIFNTIKVALNPTGFIEEPFSVQMVIDYLNKYLMYDGIAVKLENNEIVVNKTGNGLVDFSEKVLNIDIANSHLEKCKEKYNNGDFDGVITSARAFVEAILLKIAEESSGQKVPNEGDLVKLYSQVKTTLNLDPSRSDINNILKQILSGLISIITGFSGLRNKMSDAHATDYKPAERHAKLALNIAITLGEFLNDTHEHNKSRTKRNISNS